MSVKSLQIGLRWSSNGAGGADRIFTDLAFALPHAGVEFVGAVAGPCDLNRSTAGLIHSFAREDSSTVSRLRGVRGNLPKLMLAEKPDILTSHFALYTAPILDKLSARPFVMHFHGPWALESREEGASGLSARAKLYLERSVYQRADRAIVLSHAFARVLAEEYGIAPDKIRIVPGAVDLERFHIRITRSDARRSLGWPAGRPILLSVRRLVNRMGLRQLIEAVAEVKARVPEVLLYIGGTGPLREELAHRVRELGLQSNVQLLGFVPDEDLPLAYRAADFSVVPTVTLEGFGLVAAESLAAGTPSLVTNVGGLPEVVRELSGDLILPSCSPQDLAGGILDALKGTIRFPGEVDCREYAERNFSCDLMASRIASIYRECLN